jgi:hypothetical protein
MEPVLVTERLLLRRFTRDDVDGLWALDGDPAVMRYIDPRVKSRVQIEAEVLPRILAGYARYRHYGHFAADTRDGEFIGWFGLRPVTPAPLRLAAAARARILTRCGNRSRVSRHEDRSGRAQVGFGGLIGQGGEEGLGGGDRLLAVAAYLEPELIRVLAKRPGREPAAVAFERDQFPQLTCHAGHGAEHQQHAPLGPRRPQQGTPRQRLPARRPPGQGTGPERAGHRRGTAVAVHGHLRAANGTGDQILALKARLKSRRYRRIPRDGGRGASQRDDAAPAVRHWPAYARRRAAMSNLVIVNIASATLRAFSGSGSDIMSPITVG